jgi:transposase InsO family protein
MMQIARNLTMDEWGVLKPGQYLIHDRDSKYCDAFKQILDDAGVKRLPLPPKSPWLNAYAERWVKSVKDEALSRVILFGERSLHYTYCMPRFCPPLHDVICCEYNRFLTRTQLWQGKSGWRKDSTDMGTTARGITQRLHGFP